MSATQATTGITYRYFALSETETLLTLPVFCQLNFLVRLLYVQLCIYRHAKLTESDGMVHNTLLYTAVL